MQWSKSNVEGRVKHQYDIMFELTRSSTLKQVINIVARFQIPYGLIVCVGVARLKSYEFVGYLKIHIVF